MPTTDRAAVGYMLAGLSGAIDMIVPRGGKSLVARVQAEARVPVLAHLEGICHTYVHEAANPAMARAIVLNAKMRRTGICGATETLLIDRSIAGAQLKPILDALAQAGCEIRGDEMTRAIYPAAKAASEEDWRTEYLDAIIAVRVVNGVEEAIRTSKPMDRSTPIDRHGGSRRCRTLHGRAGFSHCDAQCVHTVCRWRRIWHGC